MRVAESNIGLHNLIILKGDESDWFDGKTGYIVRNRKKISFQITGGINFCDPVDASKEEDRSLGQRCAWFDLEDNFPQRYLIGGEEIHELYLNVAVCPEHYPETTKDPRPHLWAVETAKIRIENL